MITVGLAVRTGSLGLEQRRGPVLHRLAHLKTRLRLSVRRIVPPPRQSFVFEAAGMRWGFASA
jgi:hypothetical protein